MKRTRFTEEQIIGVLREQEAGTTVADLCRKHGMSSATFDAWKAKSGGIDVSDAKRLKALEEENATLKRPTCGVSDKGSELTSNAALRWAEENGVGWQYIQARQADPERLRRERHRTPSRRAPERDALPLAAAGPCHARRLASGLHRRPPALEPRLARARRLRPALGQPQQGT
jgi:putative transposase